jgi:hypothetical protein
VERLALILPPTHSSGIENSRYAIGLDVSMVDNPLAHGPVAAAKKKKEVV